MGTNQFYNHNRFYNPELGRYMEPDPIGLDGGLNPYAYVGSNPVMNTDSTGLIIDTFFDVGLASYSIYSAYKDPSWLNVGAAVFDTAAIFIPFVPAGAGASVKISTNTEKVFNATQSFKQDRKYWTQEPTIFKDLKVYKRDNLFEPQLLDARGRTNLERMETGIAPIGKDGESINLHHMLQTEKGGLVEVTKTFHQRNTKVIHINSGTAIPSGINRQEFDVWKKQYWKERAKDFR